VKILITGVCGFAGSTLALSLLEAKDGLSIFGLDNFVRAGSELNRAKLHDAGVRVQHADLRNLEDLEALPPVDCVIDAAANPSVLAGTEEGSAGSRALMQHNLVGTINLLEFCKRHQTRFIMLSTSRVYSVAPLAALSLETHESAFRPCANQTWPSGLSSEGVSEQFSSAAPVSLYGATKLCSETLALEYGGAFGFPVWINRLGVLAGAGQFGKADQGIFSYWIHSCARKAPLKFIGFGGRGFQVRDCLHPRDLSGVLRRQMTANSEPGQAVTNFGGGLANSMSLSQLHHWCEDRFGKHVVQSAPVERTFDVPWLVVDSSLARTRFGWQPATPRERILEEIATHAEQSPRWLEWSAS
jgi:CDP-paratose 2-epimerase